MDKKDKYIKESCGGGFQIRRACNDYPELPGFKNIKLRLYAKSSSGKYTKSNTLEECKRKSEAIKEHTKYFYPLEQKIIEELSKRDWSCKATEWIYIGATHSKYFENKNKASICFWVYDYANVWIAPKKVTFLLTESEEQWQAKIVKVVDEVYASAAGAIMK